jgi:hypothetical protein
MNTKASVEIFGAAALAALLGCSTSEPVAPAAPDLRTMSLYEMPMDPSAVPWNVPFGRVCKLSTSCVAMDPRPFEPCLLSTKACTDKAADPIQVGQPEWLAPPVVIETTY